MFICLDMQHNSAFDERRTLPKFSVFTECKKISSRRGRPVTFNKPGYHYSDSDSIHSDDDERSAQSKGCRRGLHVCFLYPFCLFRLYFSHSFYLFTFSWKNNTRRYILFKKKAKLWSINIFEQL